MEISEKGQLLIPKSYRDRVGIKKGTKVGLSVDGNKLIVNPLPDDPIDASRGYLKGGKSLGDALLKERRAERAKETKLRR